MNAGKKWTADESAYLEEKWGELSMPRLAKDLKRSVCAVQLRASRMGLGAFLENGDYVTWNQLLEALGVSSSCSYKKRSWIENRGLPVRRKWVKNQRFMVVNLKDFWKWAEKNRTFLDFSTFERRALGAEPDWVGEKRMRDIAKSRLCRKTPWTPSEDERLKGYLRQHRYGYKELSAKLNRTDGAICRRICDLGLKERPVKADNHSLWTAEDKEVFERMVLDGKHYESMAEVLGRSAKAIRGYAGRTLGTENLDKARSVLKERR